jgi:dihydroorotate dehydrogenase electron transfer subunit
MHQILCPVLSVRSVGLNTFVLSLHAGSLGAEARPGQFLNIKVNPGLEPLLRRPFSVYRVDGSTIELIFRVVGKGTGAMAGLLPGSTVDVLGPLGVPFTVDADDYDTGVLVAGGLGVAPLPQLTSALSARGRTIVTFLGARTAAMLVTDHLLNLRLATDDGSRGTRGTVVDLLTAALDAGQWPRPRIFGCGPTPMLRALAQLARDRAIPCEVSLEGPMACGVGICQGCPVELATGPRKYGLVCKDGPVFDVRKISLA